MPTYTNAIDVRAYTEVATLAALDDDAIEKLIDRAERDLDAEIGARARDETTGLKFVPDELTIAESDTLNRATCAQVEYRHIMGPEFFVRPQRAKVEGPEFKTEGTLPYVGPKAWRELEGSGLLKLTTSWAGADAPPWADFARNMNDDPEDVPAL